MKTFVVGFSKAKAWYKIGSTVIQEVEKRNFSHSYIRYVCPITNVELISQASHGMVNEMSLENFKKDNIIIKEYKINCLDSEFIEILTFLKKNLGVKYSRIQLILIGFKKLLRVGDVQDINKDQAFICSEWAARVCKILKLEQIPENLDTFTPSDLDRLLDELSGIYDNIELLNK